MSKNLTRKSLAFGALVALGASVIAGAPASAAGTNSGQVTLALTAGTSYNFTLGSAAVFSSNYATALDIPGYDLKFLVEDASGEATVGVAATAAGAVSGLSARTYTSGKVVVSEATDGNSALEYVAISLPSTVTASTTVNVTAFYDANGNGTIEDGEQASATREIKFLKTADVALTTTLLAPVIGSGTVKAEVTSVPELNGQQIATNSTTTATVTRGTIGVTFGQGAAAGDALATATLTYDTDSKKWTATSADVAAGGNVDAGEVFSAQASTFGTANTAVAQGTKVYATAVAASADAAKSTAVVTASADVNPDAAGTSAVVRTAQKTVSYALTVLKADGTTAVAANTAVAVGWTGTMAGTVKINGTSTASGSTKTVYTDASGKVTVTVNAASAIATNNLTLTNEVDGVDQESVTFTWNDASYTLYEVQDRASGDDFAAVAGTSYTQEFRLVDQFGVGVPAGYGLRVVSAGRTVSNQVFAFSNGVATVTVTDGNVTGTQATLTLDVVKADGASWTAGDLTGPTQQTRVVNFASATATYALTVAETTQTDSIASAEAKAADSRLNNVDANTFSASERIAITGNVKNAVTGAVREGALVTVSGTGLLFNVGSVYAKDSLTFRATDAGTFSVDVISNKVVTDQVVTVASEGVSKTTKVSFTAALVAKTFTLSVPTFIGAGRAVDVVATLADKWGNAPTGSHTITFSSTGAGYLNGSSAVVDASGKATLKLIVSVGETGSAVVTATTTNTDIAAASRSITATATIGAAPVVAPTVVVAISGSTGKVYVSVTNAAGKKVVVKVSAKFAKSFTGTLAKKSVAVLAAKGSKKITVYVGGKLVATKTVTIK